MVRNKKLYKLNNMLLVKLQKYACSNKSSYVKIPEAEINYTIQADLTMQKEPVEWKAIPYQHQKVHTEE